MKPNALTILLTLKGRHLHTVRWLWHANRINLPFHVLVADGEVHPTIARLLSNPATFPNLSFEYHQYADTSLSDFYLKCADAIGKVQTPYVKMADNDDFLFPFGLNKCVAFLDSAQAYVCAGGGIPGFSVNALSSVASDLIGPVRRVRYRCFYDGSYQCRDIDSPSAANRVLGLINNPLVVYYNIYRSQALRVIAEEILAYNVNVRIHEIYWTLRTATLGKVKSDPSYFTYFRQQGTSSNAASERDWVDHLLRYRFPQDFEAMASKLAFEAAKSDNSDQSEINERIFEAYAEVLRIALANTMMRYRFPRLFALKQRFLSLPRIRLMPALLQRRLDQKRIWKQLAADGADRDTIAAHERELENIMATLQGDEFIKFVSRSAPDLLKAP